MTQEDIIRMALEALEVSTDWDVNATGKQAQSMRAITALRQCLEQQPDDHSLDRYQWLVDNAASWKWEPSKVYVGKVSGFSYKGTGYLGYSFYEDVGMAMLAAAPKQQEK